MSCFDVHILEPSINILEIETCIGNEPSSIDVITYDNISAVEVLHCVALLPSDINELITVKDIIGNSGILVSNSSGIYSISLSNPELYSYNIVDFLSSVQNIIGNSGLISGDYTLITYNSGTGLTQIAITGLQPSGNYSLIGHNHYSNDIIDWNTSISGLLPTITGSQYALVSFDDNIYHIDISGLQPSGNYSSIGHTHTSSYITNFDNAVSGLIPSIVGTGYVYTLITDNSRIIGVSGLQPSGNYSIIGHTHTSSNITDFNSAVSGLIPPSNFTSLSGVSGIIVTNSGTNYFVGLNDPSIQLADITDLSANARTFLLTSSSNNLKTLISDETGSGVLVFNNSPAFSGIPTVPTAASGTNSNQIASTSFVRTEISNLVDSAPSTLDTLNELAAALGDDPNFATTITNTLASKANLSGAIFTGSVTIPSGTANFNSLSVNGTSVSTSGHTHTSSNITDFNSSVSGLLPSISGSGYVSSSFNNNIYTISVSGLQPSGNYSLVGHTHNISDIIDFDSSVIVYTTGNQTIDGVKTFTDNIFINDLLVSVKPIYEGMTLNLADTQLSGHRFKIINIDNYGDLNSYTITLPDDSLPGDCIILSFGTVISDITIRMRRHNGSGYGPMYTPMGFVRGSIYPFNRSYIYYSDSRSNNSIPAGFYRAWINIPSSEHNHGNITDHGEIGSVSGLLVITSDNGLLTTTSGINSNYITNFNSSVSGLLPVKNVTGSGYVNVSSSSGIYNIAVTGLQPSGNYANSIHSHGNITSSGTIGTTAGKAIVTSTSGLLIASDSVTNSQWAYGLYNNQADPPQPYLSFDENNFYWHDGLFANNFRASINAASSVHSHGDITNSGTIGSTSGLLVVTGSGGVLTTSSGVSSSYITNFNSSVSGLLPVKNILGSGYINVGSSSGVYTISATGLQPSGNYSVVDHNHGNITSSGTIGSTSGLLVITGNSGVLTTTSGITSSYITNFNSSVSGLLPTISNSGNNRILTSTGSSVGINAENNLTFDGNILQIYGGPNSGGSGIIFQPSQSYTDGLSKIIFDGNNINAYIEADEGSELFTIYSNAAIAISGSSLMFNGTNISVNGHTHSSVDITGFNSSVSGLLPSVSGSGYATTSFANNTYTVSVTGLQPSGNYSTVGHTHTASNITDFNSSVSGLLPSVSGSGYAVSSFANNVYTVSVTGLQPSGNYSTVGHTHTASNITDFNSSVSGLLPSVSGSGYATTSFANNIYTVSVTGLQPSGNYSTVGHTHTASDIGDFNSSVSGLLPIKDISAGSGIGIASLSGNYTVSVTGTFGLTSEEVDDRVSQLLVAGSGINLNYIDSSNQLIITSLSESPVSIRGYEQIISNKTSFNIPETYIIGQLDIYFNGVKLLNGIDYTATNGSSFTLTQTATSGDIVEWLGLSGYGSYLPYALEQFDDRMNELLVAGTGINLNYDDPNNNLTISVTGVSFTNHTHTSSNITDFNSSVSGLIPVKNIIGGTGISVSSLSGIYTIDSTGSGVLSDQSKALVTTVFNKTGSPIPKMTAVYINGGQGDLPTVSLAIATSDMTSAGTYGLTYETINNMSSGKVIVFGALTGLNTDQFNPTAPQGNVNGSVLYLSPTVSGSLTLSKPSAPNHIVAIGTIVRTHQNEGVIEVRVQNGFELEELHNVAISGASNGQFLQYNSSSGLWVSSSSGNFTTLQLNGTGVVASSGGNSGYLSKFTESNTIDNSVIYQSGNNIGIGTTNPQTLIHASGLATGVGSLFRLQNGSSSNNTYFETRIGTPGNFDDYIFFNRNGTNFFGATNTSQLYLPNHTQVASNRQITSESNANAVLNLYNASAQTELGYVSGNALRFLRNYVEVARFDGNGNFGIGTTTPSGRLDVAGDVYVRGTGNNLGTIYIKSSASTDTSLKLRSDSQGNLFLDAGAYIKVGNQDGTAMVQGYTGPVTIGHLSNSNNNQNIIFNPRAIERARLTHDGNFGIGISAPSGQLHVVGTGIISSRLGIGTNNPSVPLEVAGNAFIDGNLVFDSFTESVVAIGNSSTSQTLSLASGTVQTCTLTGNCTFTMPTTTAGKSFTVFLNTGSGNYTANFSGVLWNDSAPPTITTTASKVDILSFISDGSYWYGSYSQNYG